MSKILSLHDFPIDQLIGEYYLINSLVHCDNVPNYFMARYDQTHYDYNATVINIDVYDIEVYYTLLPTRIRVSIYQYERDIADAVNDVYYVPYDVTEEYLFQLETVRDLQGMSFERVNLLRAIKEKYEDILNDHGKMNNDY